MQQTNKYHFNLVESGDTFSPAPLNENMEKVEAALNGLAGELGTGGQTCRIVYGSYVGTGGAKTMKFDFRPMVVILSTMYVGAAYFPAILLRGTDCTTNGTAGVSDISWTENSVTFGSQNNDAYNYSNRATYYIAIGV